LHQQAGLGLANPVFEVGTKPQSGAYGLFANAAVPTVFLEMRKVEIHSV
jgi:hypothetical protein